MGRGRGRSEASKTLNSAAQAAAEDENTSIDGKGFFACYLLASLNPRYKGHTYIGFTVNPRRRIRQHNGEIGCGAWRTKKRRPWEMVLCIYGFPTNVSALQFEWAWQHPVASLAVRKAAASFKSLSGIANKIKLAYTMLTLPSWQSMKITINFFSTKHMKHCAGCPRLPQHMKVQIYSVDELPCYAEGVDGFSEKDDDGIEEECENNTHNSDSVPDTFDDSVTHNSPEIQNQGDTSIVTCEWNKESGAKEHFHSFALQDQRQPIGSVMLQMEKSLPVTSSEREEITKEKEFMNLMSKTTAVLSQPECKQSNTELAANTNQEFSSAFKVTPEAEIIDLSTPSPCIKNSSDSKKRRISSVCTNIIDLTKSPSYVQL